MTLGDHSRVGSACSVVDRSRPPMLIATPCHRLCARPCRRSAQPCRPADSRQPLLLRAQLVPMYRIWRPCIGVAATRQPGRAEAAGRRPSGRAKWRSGCAGLRPAYGEWERVRACALFRPAAQRRRAAGARGRAGQHRACDLLCRRCCCRRFASPSGLAERTVRPAWLMRRSLRPRRASPRPWSTPAPNTVQPSDGAALAAPAMTVLRAGASGSWRRMSAYLAANGSRGRARPLATRLAGGARRRH